MLVNREIELCAITQSLDKRQMTLGDRIAERLKLIGISQAELARRVGVRQSTMNSLINGDSRSSRSIVAIAAELRTTPAYLTGANPDPDENAPALRTTEVEHVMMAVALPPVRALARMFEGLLRGIGPDASLDEQALLLAQRLPIGLSQLRDLLPDPATPPAPAAAEARAMHDAEPQP